MNRSTLFALVCTLLLISFHMKSQDMDIAVFAWNTECTDDAEEHTYSRIMTEDTDGEKEGNTIVEEYVAIPFVPYNLLEKRSSDEFNSGIREFCLDEVVNRDRGEKVGKGMNSISSSCPDVADYNALMALYNATDGSNWVDNTGWDQDCDICSWYGIFCDSDGRVTHIFLGQNNLVGVIPSEIENLSNLQNLALTTNDLTGSIPIEIGNLSNLTHLYLSQNNLEDSIPSEIANLTNLEVFTAGSNNLMGSIPTELGSLSNLQTLQLGQNNLSGGIPSEFGELSSLTSLNLNDNSLTGSIPIELGNISNITLLRLERNNLTGSLPIELGNLTNLQTLYIYETLLTGPIPSELGDLPNLNFLWLYNNNLDGCIPSSLLNLCAQNVNLSGNSCLSHNGGDFASFCAGDPCEGSSASCTTCSDSIQNGSETGVDCGGICEICPSISYGAIEDVGESWITVNLDQSYSSMVVVATVEMTSKSLSPVVTRIRNAVGNSFEIRIQVPGIGNSTTDTYDVSYVVAQEGIYTEAEHGIKMEAVKVLSTMTSATSDWKFESRSYQQSYTSPVVIGQVMSYNDTDWSVFWASSATLSSSPPNASSFSVGKHVGEDSDKIRTDETIGYIAMETSSGTINGDTEYAAILGADIVTDASHTYFFSEVTAPEIAILSSAGINDDDGGWPVLLGEDPIASDEFSLSYDEDQIDDSERNHTTEQVAYVVFGQMDTCSDGIQNGDETGVDCGGICVPCSQLDLSANSLVPFYEDNLWYAGNSDFLTLNYTLAGEEINTLPIKIYLSEDAVLDASDGDAIKTSNYTQNNGLGTFDFLEYVSIPSDVNSGDYYLIISMNEDSYYEVDMTNNTASFPLTIYNAHCNNGQQDGDETGPDCGGSCLPCSQMDLAANSLAPFYEDNLWYAGNSDFLTLNYTLSEEEVTTLPIKIYLSEDAVLDTSDGDAIKTSNYTQNNGLGTFDFLEYVSIPSDVNSGDYYLIVSMNEDTYYEADMANNMASFPLTIYNEHCNNGQEDGDETGPDCGGSCLPCSQMDLAANSLAAFYEDNLWYAGNSDFLTLNYTLSEEEVNTLPIKIYLSEDTVLDASDGDAIKTSNYTQNNGLGTFDFLEYVSIPSDVNSGDYYLIVSMNEDTYYEADMANNMAFFPLTIYNEHCNNGQQDGDETGTDCGGSCLSCSQLDLAANSLAPIYEDNLWYAGNSDFVTLNYTLSEEEINTLPMKFYLSEDMVLDASDGDAIQTNNYGQYNGLGTFDLTVYVSIPSDVNPGDYHLIISMNEDSYYEPDMTNNTASFPITIYNEHCSNGQQDGDETGPDCGGSCLPCSQLDLAANSLAPIYEDNLWYAGNSDFVTLNYTLSEEEINTLPMKFYLSEDMVLDASDGDAIQTNNYGQYNGLGTFDLTVYVSIPSDANSGDYYLIISMNEDSYYESDMTNNTASFPITIYNEHCSNGQQDGDESGPDCGGSCLPCSQMDLAANALVPYYEGVQWYVDNSSFVILNYTLSVEEANSLPLKFYLSDDAVLDASDGDAIQTNNYGQNNGLGTFDLWVYLSIPSDVDPGDYHLIVSMNEDSYYEADMTNNVTSLPITIYGQYCNNGLLDPGEDDIDCGGDCEPCPASCTDGIRNGDETGVDCGGSCDPCPPAVDYEVSSLELTPDCPLPGGDVNVMATVTNIGELDAPGTSRTGYYLSTDAILDGSDINLCNGSGLGICPFQTNLPSGSSNVTSYDVIIPAETAPGSYFVLVQADKDNSLPDPYVENDVNAIPIQVIAPHCINEVLDGDETDIDCGGSCLSCNLPDLNLSNLNLSISSLPMGGDVLVDVDIANSGGQDITESIELGFFLSIDNVLYTLQDDLILLDNMAGLDIGQSTSVSTLITIPESTSEGDYYLMVSANPYSNIIEATKSNNTLSLPITIVPPATCTDGIQNQDEEDVDCGGVCPPCFPFELTLNTFSISGAPTLYRGQTVSGSADYTISERDLDNGTPVAIYLSTDDQLDIEVDDQIWDATYSFETQGTRTLSLSGIVLPMDVAIGNYYLIFKLDWDDIYYELNEGDNTMAVAIELIQETCDDGVQNQEEEGIDCGGPNCPPCPNIDFIANTFSINQGSNLYRGQTVQGDANYTLANQSSSSTPIAIYLSVDDQWDTGDGVPIHTANFSFNTIGTRALTISNISIPMSVAVGDYFLIFRLDPDMMYDEEFEDNNTAAYAITLLQETCDDGIQNQEEEGIDCGGPNCTACPNIDFIANSFNINGDGTYFRGQTLSGSANYTLANQSSNNTPVAIYISEDGVLDTQSDPEIWTATYGFNTIGTRSLTISSVILPQDIALGNYNLIFKLDHDDVYDEGDNEDNNTALFPIVITDYPDLIVSQPVLDNDIWTQGQVINIQTTVETANEIDVNTTFSVELFVSENATFEQGVDVSIYSTDTGPLTGLSSLNLDEDFVLNQSFAPGTYYLIVYVDAGEVVYEGAVYELNNTSNMQVTIDDPCINVAVNQADHIALMALYNATEGGTWTRNEGWASDDCNVCSWSGVICDNSDRVSRLQLIDNNLIGSLPEAISGLSELKSLVISNNPDLTDTIPQSLGALASLEYLVLSGNNLSGEIPVSLGSLSFLKTILLNDNQLSGNIPPSLGGLSNLMEMRLSHNLLDGVIPPEMGNLTSAARIYLNDNDLSGCIPISFDSYCGTTLVRLNCNPCLSHDQGNDFASFCAGDACTIAQVPECEDCEGCTEEVIAIEDEEGASTDLALENKELDERDGIKIYPNPTLNFITIESQSGLSEAQIALYNLTGRLMYSSTLLSSSIEVDMSSMPPGTYILHVENDQYQLIRKVIKID